MPRWDHGADSAHRVRCRARGHPQFRRVVSLLRPSTAANRGARLFENNNKCRFPVNCICTHATGSRPQKTRRARMTRRPPVSECRDETTCLRPSVPMGHKVSLDPTRQQARHPKCNCSEHLNRRQPTRNVRRTDARNQTPLTPWRTQKRQQ